MYFCHFRPHGDAASHSGGLLEKHLRVAVCSQTPFYVNLEVVKQNLQHFWQCIMASSHQTPPKEPQAPLWESLVYARRMAAALICCTSLPFVWFILIKNKPLQIFPPYQCSISSFGNTASVASCHGCMPVYKMKMGQALFTGSGLTLMWQKLVPNVVSCL